MKPVKPKIVSKDNSSPSAKEQTKLTKYGKVELIPLAEKLMAFAKEDKSVLLYGDYAGDLYVFMNGFHKEMNDKNPLFKYVGKENMPEDFNPDEYLATEMRKAIENRKHKKIYELFRDFKRTENTYLHIDCQNDDGETVLKKLTGVENFTKNEVLERISSMMKHNENWETFYADIVDYKGHLREKRSSTNYFCEPYSLSTSYCRRRLLAREGTLFVENLICEQDNPKDKASYERLAAQIKKDKYEGEDEGVWSISLSGWLVVCAYDFTTFPQRFLDQFVMVPLDDSEARQQNKEINKEGVVVEPSKAVTGRRSVNIDGIKKKRGSKPKNPKHGEFVGILDDILEYGEDISLGKYVKKVKTEMEKRGLKKKTKNTGQEEGFIYTDKTIKTYIQKHPNYKKIQKRRENHKKA
jgi:hypothetical protein